MRLRAAGRSIPSSLVEHRHHQIASPLKDGDRAFFRGTILIGPLSAATAAACAIEHGLEVDCDWSLAIALISHAARRRR